MQTNALPLTIAIPTYGNFQTLLLCLRSLTTYTEYPYRIIVVNNGSAQDIDGNQFEDQLRSVITYPHMTVIQAERNLGWMGGINRAFLECESEYFCMCNDDLVFLTFDRHFWQRLMTHFRYPEIGAVAPASNFVMGSQNIRDMRGGMMFCASYLIGMLMVTRSKLFSEIGGLDETLPGGDDLDYSMLVRKAGYRLLVNKTCFVHHIGSQTGPKVHSHWNTADHVDLTNNVLQNKHGMVEWADTISNWTEPFEPITLTSDIEGDTIRAWVAGKANGHELRGLDIGCGANKTLQDATGIDHKSPEDIGEGGGTKGTHSVADIVADAGSVPLPDKSQDYIIARHVLEHISDTFAVLDEWKRLLKDDGILIIACPDEDAVRSILMDWTHLHAWTPEALNKVLIKAGFEIEETRLIREPGYQQVVKCRKRQTRGYSPAEFLTITKANTKWLA